MLIAPFVFQMWIAFSHTPPKLVLHTGQSIMKLKGYHINKETFQFELHRQGHCFIRFRDVDFKRTFFPPPKPKPKLKPTKRIQREVPWSHPDYRFKKKGFKMIRIKNNDLMEYVNEHGVWRPSRVKIQPDPEQKVSPAEKTPDQQDKDQ